MRITDVESRIDFIKQLESLQPDKRYINANKTEVVYRLGNDHAALAAIDKDGTERLIYGGTFFGVAARVGFGRWYMQNIPGR